MDPILIPIVAVAVGIPGTVAFVAIISSHVRKMKELAIRDRELGAGAASEPVMEALREDVEDIRSKLVEMHERLEFTERLLSAPRTDQEHRS